jgi:quercetin dioxygenase-like cupin family protein
MESRTPLLLVDQEGEHIHYDGGLLTFKATGKQTDGSLLMFEVRMPRGKATPLHVHPDADETFKLLDGQIRMSVGGRESIVADGAVSLVPRGTPHAFTVESEWAHILVLFTPASAVSEEFFRLAGIPAADPSATPPPPDPDRFAAAVTTAGLQILGPPPFVLD